MSERKACIVSVALDRDLAATVKRVAEQTTEGNRSLAIRQMIRTAAPAILAGTERTPAAPAIGKK